jgi:hypothetical protein
MNKLEEYLHGQGEPHKTRTRNALEMKVRLNGGEILTRAKIVERRVAAGAKVVNKGKLGAVLMSPDGSFLDEKNITKRGITYALFLLY